MESYPGAHVTAQFHSISYGEHGYNSMGMSSLRTADTVFEINSIPEVRRCLLRRQRRPSIYLTELQRRIHYGFWPDEHGSVMSSATACMSANPKGLIEVEP